MNLASIQSLLDRYTRKRSAIAARRKELQKTIRKSISVERLEARQLMAADLSTFLTHEHVDLNIARTGSSWSIGPRNSDVNPAIQYENDEALLYVGAESIVARPASSDLAFIGVGAGENFYLLPQAQNPDALFLGFAAYGLETSTIDRYDLSGESKGRKSGVARWSKVTLVDLRHTNADGSNGDGQFSVWQTGIFGTQTVYMSSYDDGVINPNGNGLDVTDGISLDDALWPIAGGHDHYNFGFTRPGRYEIDFRLSAYIGDNGSNAPNLAGYSQSEIVTLYFSVQSVGELQFDAATYSVNESAGTASIDVIRVGGSDGRIAVNYVTNNGTATAGSDYTTVSGTLEFLDGQTRRTIPIPIIDDGDDEANETVQLALSAPSPINMHQYLVNTDGDANGLLGAITTASLTIIDNDETSNAAPTISPIGDQFLLTGNTLGPIPFMVGDAETPSGDLLVTATSSNPSVIPNGNILLGGSGENRTITLTSLPDQVGATTITMTVTDAGGAQTSKTFVLTVGDLVRATFDRSAGIKSVDDIVDVRLADIDNDGDLDVLYATWVNSIAILPNNGDGTFGTEIELPALTVSDIHVADVNGDNLPDIVSGVYVDTTYAETAIAIWRNLGVDGFSDMELVESTRTTNFAYLTGVDDVDGDGRNDLVLEDNGHSWFRNLGGTTFGARVSIAPSGLNYGAVLQDADQDGDVDIVQMTLSNEEFKLQLYRNSGTATPSFTTETLASFGDLGIANIAMGDTNQDGFVDIHVTRWNSTHDILALHGTAAGTFSAPVVLASGGAGSSLTGLQIGDIDGDNRPDLVLSRRDVNQILFAQNLGAGAFTVLQEFTSDGVYLNPGHEWVDVGDIDGDGRVDLVYGERFGDRIAWSKNRSEEDITALTAPASRTYLNGYPMTFDMFLGFNAKLNTSSGSPTLPVTIGSQTIQVPFIGQPNANTLRFRYLVQSTDIDLDGIQVANSVVLNGATITDIHDRPLGPELLEYDSVDTTGVLVNGGAPYVAGIMRLDPTPATSSTVRFEVTFSEPVTGVGPDDFTLDANGPTGAAITSVTGSGNSYVVTANIGTGDGTLKLRVLDDDSISDTDAHPLGGVGLGNGEFALGQGYTIRSSTATPVFNNVLTDGHMDLSLLLYEGTWYPYWNGVGFWDTTDTVLSAGPDARVTRPDDSKWNFLGADAGETVWIFPETFSTTTPWPGVGAYDNQPGAFASYFESDPRVNATAAWLTMQLLDVRGPEGGEFSLYQSGITDPIVFMSSADGIGANDTAWIPNLDHIHYNWAFSKPGLYQIDVVASGYIDFNQTGTYEPGVDPLSESQIITLHFGVEVSPTITELGDRTVVAGESAGPIDFTIGDLESSAADLLVTAISSNQSVLPNGNIVLAGSGVERNITLTTVAGQVGSTTITVSVTDTNGLTTNETFVLTVTNERELVAFAKPWSIGSSSIFPWYIDIADINGDGEEDILAISGNNSQLAWYAGDGLGGFSPEQLIQPAGDFTGPFFAEAYDLDSDGDLDILTTHQFESKVSWFEQLSDGSFSPEKIISQTVAAPRHGTAADVDGDGLLDLLIPARNGDNLSLFKNLGSGAFADPTVIASGLDLALFVVATDLSGDGKVDVAVTSGLDNKLSLLLNDGSGNFPSIQTISTAHARPGHVIAADLNNDDTPDLALVSSTSGEVVWYANDGSGNFGAQNVISSGQHARPNSIAAGDLDNDGDLDVVVVSIDDDKVAWYENQGGGSFGPAQVVSTFPTSPSFLKLADFDDDGDLDMAASFVLGEHSIQYYENRLGDPAKELLPPTDGTYFQGASLDFRLFFGASVLVDTTGGVPSIPLTIGDTTKSAVYVGGSGTSTLTFRYVVDQSDVDLDGLSVGAEIALNGGSIETYLGAADLAVPSVDSSGIIINGALPILRSIERLQSRVVASGLLSFQVEFSQSVTGVDASDFALHRSGDVSGASIVSVTGGDTTWIVQIASGPDEGTIRLDVVDDDTIVSGSATLAGTVDGSFRGGEVYTIRNSNEVPQFENFVTEDHVDVDVTYLSADDSWTLNASVYRYATDEFEVYGADELLITSGQAAQEVTPNGSEWSFLGTMPGEPVWVMPQFPDVGDASPGIAGYSDVAGTFASYFESDPRVGAAAPWIRLQLVDVRGPAGGMFSVFQTGFTPKVLMATSDGISDSDVVWAMEGSHDHYSWGFSKPGLYAVDLFAWGYVDENGNGVFDEGVDRYSESGVVTYYLSVDAPLATDDKFTLSNLETLRGNVALNDRVEQGDSLTVSLEENASHGSLTLHPNGSFIYTPSASFPGSDRFTYRLSNERGGFTTATVTLASADLPAFIAGLNQGHADIGIAYEEDSWDLHVHVGSDEDHEDGEDGDDHEHEHEHEGLEYGPDQIQIQLGASSVTTMPADPSFAFLGAASGASIFVLPSTENPQLPFLGFGTEEIENGTFIDGELKLHLKTVSGPGHFSLWSTDVLGVPTPFFTTFGGVDSNDVLALSEGTHTHLNMAFTQPGTYAITFEAMATLSDGETVVRSGDVTYHFAVLLGVAPTVSLADSEMKYTEQSGARIIDSSALVTDSDSIQFDGGELRVDFPSYSHPDDVLGIRSLSGNNQIGVDGNNVTIGVPGGGTVVIGTFSGGAGGEPLVVSFNANATPARVTRLLRNITFQNASDDPTESHRAVRFVIHDGDGLLSDAALREIEVLPVNDAPVVTNSSGMMEYDENDMESIIDAMVTISDVDSPNFGSGSLTVSIQNRQNTDRLSIQSQGDGPGQINVSGSDVLYEGLPIGNFVGGFTSDAPLIVSFNDNATPEAVQQLARQITFHNVGDNPTSVVRTIRFQVNDGDGRSSTSTKQIAVNVFNDAPTIGSLGPETSYTEDGLPTRIAEGSLVSDSDSPNFEGGELLVEITSGGTDSDKLAIPNQGLGHGRINTVGNNVTRQIGGVVVIIGKWQGGTRSSPLRIMFNANADLWNVRALAQSLIFQVIGSTPDSHRTVRMTLSDGDGGVSQPEERTIRVVAVNDAPTITTSPGSTPYTPGGAGAVIDGAVVIDDVDSTNFAGGFLDISIVANRQSTDRLMIIAEGDGVNEINLSGLNVLYGGIVIGTYSGGFTSSSPLRIQFNENAMLSAVRKLARRIGFSSVSLAPSLLDRTIIFVVNDGDGRSSPPASKIIDVG